MRQPEPSDNLGGKQRETEAALRKERDFLAGLIQASPVFIVALSPQGKILMMNDAMLTALGYTLPEVVGKDYLATFIPEGDRRPLLRAFYRIQKSQEPFRGENRVLTRDGRGLLVEWSAQAVFNENGDIDFFYGLGQDITKRRIVEEALAESWERQASILDAIPDLVYEMTLDGTLIYANRTASEILGITPANRSASAALANTLESSSASPIPGSNPGGLEGMSAEPQGLIRFTDFLGDAESERFHRDLVALGREKGSTRNLFYDLRVPDGHPLPIEVRATLLERKAQAPTLLFVARDVSYRRRLEERFRQSQRMEAVGRLAGGIAHEFNNLMTTITGYSDLMLLTLRQDDPLRQRVEDIRRATEAANTLTRQLMAFNRRQFLQPQAINLNEVLADLEWVLRRLIGEDIELVADLDPEIGWVRLDKQQIEQAILNLAFNSRDAMSAGGRLLVQTRNVELDGAYAAEHAPMKPGPYVMLAVTDTGVGMDAETRSHVFEPFFSTKEKGQGTGLGLSTVYGTVKQSGGYIWVYSEPERGTTFKIYLPRVAGGALPEAQTHPPAPRRLEGTETILLVEDQDSLREIAREVLHRKGYNVLEARNAGEALLICEQHTGLVHLMLTDVVMPRMGGRELYERLRPWHPEMKVLYMSGYTDDAVILNGLLAPEAAFLEKPFSPEGLTRKVREVLESSRGK